MEAMVVLHYPLNWTLERTAIALSLAGAIARKSFPFVILIKESIYL